MVYFHFFSWNSPGGFTKVDFRPLGMAELFWSNEQQRRHLECVSGDYMPIISVKVMERLRFGYSGILGSNNRGYKGFY
ncbi:hypothetical protein C4J81_01985 [Deltaproteobacteria bacterium Smac51]|nr:hypothetical protein C4J81_01985 [Deltaproteobacteria bacterium Smac51]